MNKQCKTTEKQPEFRQKFAEKKLILPKDKKKKPTTFVKKLQKTRFLLNYHGKKRDFG